MNTNGSAAFKRSEDGGYLQAPSPKRVRYENANGEPTEVMHVSDMVETVQTGDPNEVDTVTITVPSSQFEIEINSQVEEDETDEIPQIQRSDLTGPAFDIIQDTHDYPEDARADDGSTLNAIGRALLQMQQGNHNSQHNTMPVSSSQQIFLSRPSTTESDIANQNAPLYVMIPPVSSAEILQAMGQTRPIAPKTTSVSMTMTTQDDSNIDPKSREAQRKATHNEVERRRRDRINELIKMLAMIVPGCQKKDATTGTIVGYVYSKGTVLDKTVEYLRELITQNDQLAGTAKLAEKSANALSLLQNQITVLEKENAFLRAQIIQFGIDAAASNTQSSNVNRQILNSPLAQSLLNTVAQTSLVNPPHPIPPPPPPPPPPQKSGGSSTQAAAQQLLLSLAQSLTNSPLLTSIAQNTGSFASNVTTSPSRLTTSTTLTATPHRYLPLPPSSQVSTPITTQQQLAPLPLPLPAPVAGGNSPAQVAPLLNSLVHTLASIANTNTSPMPKASPPISTTPAQTVPPSQQQQQHISGGLSAAAAASLLNTLIMAQNVLTNNCGSSSGSSMGMGEQTSSVLSSVGLDAVRGEQ